VPVMKRSDETAERLDLDRGLPTTAEDVAAQDRLRAPRLTMSEYVRWLGTLPRPDPRSERMRSISIGEPFTLDS
jgi:hypothetical protein